MKRILFLLLCILVVQGMFSQSVRRRTEQQEARKDHAGTITPRARISFPTAMDMDENVVWRRDVYRELDLNEDANAALYYPVEPAGAQMNLFTYIFKLFMKGQLKAYEYRLDGNEVFNEAAEVKRKAFLDNYHIFYETTDRGTHIDDSDIPSREVTAYYIKESSYYDQVSATFHTKVQALCPVMKREDDFGGGATSFPLFWIRYDDLAPFLSKQVVMTSNLNNAARMSMDDYFAKNAYRGKIYKTANMLGKTLAQYCPDEASMTREQKRIEGEIKAFEEHIWGDKARKDSLDSIAMVVKDQKQVIRKNRRVQAGANSSIRAKRKSTSGSVSGPSARVTVRRERH